jgi:glyoxylase I family protein
LRHLAFEVNNVEQTRSFLTQNNIPSEDIRVDEYTGKQFFFIADQMIYP